MAKKKLERKFDVEEDEFLGGETHDEYDDPLPDAENLENDGIEPSDDPDPLGEELAEEEKQTLPIKRQSGPRTDPSRMDASTPQEVKDLLEPGRIVEIPGGKFNEGNVIRKKIPQEVLDRGDKGRGSL